MFRDGLEGEKVTFEAARAEGFQIVDLGDDWVPRVLAVPAEAAPSVGQRYQATYVALANEQLNAHPPHQRFERYLELLDLFADDACCFDEGVRTHGSVSYESILHGYSHGCHRLFNHLALRLMGFLLGHRYHVRVGDIAIRYDREVGVAGQKLVLPVRSRGYRYQLVPPIPVDVLEGRVRGRRPAARQLQSAREPAVPRWHERCLSASEHSVDASARPSRRYP